MNRRIRVLVVDDSAMVRQLMSEILSADKEIEVVGVASNPYVARDKIIELKPDVLTLDIEMPKMNGLEFLKKLMPQHPLPVIMVSALTEKGKKITIDCLEAGAVDFVSKPHSDIERGLEIMADDLRSKVKMAATANLSKWKTGRTPSSNPDVVQSPMHGEFGGKVIAIGASAGGTQALREVLSRLPETAPGLVIVQHMPAGFTKLFANRMNDYCKVNVKEACNGDKIIAGRALIAPGGLQMRVTRSEGSYCVRCNHEDEICGHAPSVEALMQSVAMHVGPNAVGVILTGMGSDGADGLKAMRDAGARTLAQDEATSVVFGMPKVAWERGGAEELVPLGEIAKTIMSFFTRSA